MNHNAQLKHLTSGWLRWAAACPCGWSVTPMGGREEARDRADQHNDENGVTDGGDLQLSCTCYSALDMEYAPEPCAYCQRLESQGIA